MTRFSRRSIRPTPAPSGAFFAVVSLAFAGAVAAALFVHEMPSRWPW
jgi:hypothetical protein